MAKKAKKKSSDAPDFGDYEALIETVEGKLRELEEGELSLDQSLKAYEAGVGALKKCYDILKQAEGKIMLLSETGDEPKLAEYDIESGGVVESEDDDEEGSAKGLF